MADRLWRRASIAALAISLAATILAARSTTTHQPALGAVPLRIMPLGDSITLGNGPDHSWRGFLANQLTSAGISYDFVGSYGNIVPPGGVDTWAWAEDSQLNYSGVIDKDFEGHGGFQAGQPQSVIGYRDHMLAQMVATDIPLFQPDIVLMHIGTNDYLGGWTTHGPWHGPAGDFDHRIEYSAQNVKDLIDAIHALRPTTTILVGSIGKTGLNNTLTELATLSGFVRDHISLRSSQGWPVSYVGELYDQITTADLSADGLHPVDSGYQKLANAWFPRVKTVIDGIPLGGTTTTTTTTTIPPEATTTILYEAEQAASNLAVRTANPGYTGTGYRLSEQVLGDYVDWTINASTAGNYPMRFRYSNGCCESKRALYLNGTRVTDQFTFPVTGSWTTWQTVETKLALTAGPNHVRLQYDGWPGVNWMAFDSLTRGPIDATPPDFTAPSAPTNLVATPGSTSIALGWTASTDNVAVTGYEVLVNGVTVQSVTTPGATVSGLTPATSFTIAVRARDAMFNLSPAATTTVSTTAVVADTQAPSAPTNLRSTTNTAASYTLAWSAATDNVAVTGYDVLVNNVVNQSVTGLTVTVSGLPANSATTFAVRAKDAAGNTSSLATLAAGIASADSYASSGSPTQNFGTRSSLSIASPGFGDTRWAYLRFPVPTAPAAVSTATLRLSGFASRTNGITLDAYAVASNTWTETGLAWNNKPALGASRLSVSPTVRNNNLALVDLDVTAAVQAARTAGQPAVTLAVRVTGTNSITYTANSREATSGRPTLLVAGV